MNSFDQVVKNFRFLLFSEIVSKVFIFLNGSLIVRYLLAGKFGVLSFALAFTSILGIVMDLGLNLLIIREVSKEREGFARYFNNILTVKLILALLIYIAAFCVLKLLGYSPEIRRVVYIMMFFAIFNSIVLTCNAMFQAFEKMEYQAGGVVFYNLLLFTGIISGRALGLSVIGFAWIYSLAALFLCFYSLILYSVKIGNLKFSIEGKFLRRIIKMALPFFVIDSCVALYFYADTVMLSLLVPDPEKSIGWYNAATRISLFLQFIPLVFSTALFPLASRISIVSDGSLSRMHRRSVRLLSLIGIPLGFGISLFAEIIIKTVFGATYLPAAYSLRISIWATILIFLTTPFTRLMFVLDKQFLVARITLLFTAVTIFLNSLLIPHFGYIGASVSAVVGMSVSMILSSVVAHRLGYPLYRKMYVDIAKIVLVGLFASAAIKIFNAGTAISLFIFLCPNIYFFLRIIDKEERQYFKSIFRYRI